MSFSWYRNLVREGILDCLECCTPLLRELVSNPGGSYPINGMAVGIIPWFGQAWIAFRVQSDRETLKSAEWKHSNEFFSICVCHAGPLADAGEYASEAWENPPNGLSRKRIAHLIYLAGAEALLDDSVRYRFHEILDSFDVGAKFEKRLSFKDQIRSNDGWFDYVVSDPDQVCRLNYCDLVLANEVAKASLPAWEQPGTH